MRNTLPRLIVSFDASCSLFLYLIQLLTESQRSTTSTASLWSRLRARRAVREAGEARRAKPHPLHEPEEKASVRESLCGDEVVLKHAGRQPKQIRLAAASGDGSEATANKAWHVATRNGMRRLRAASHSLTKSALTCQVMRHVS